MWQPQPLGRSRPTFLTPPFLPHPPRLYPPRHPPPFCRDDSVLDDILTPMERNVKAYLVAAVSKDLLELLALMAVERPDDPHLWLGSKLLERSPNGPFIATKKSVYAGVRVGREAAGGAGEGEGSSSSSSSGQ